MSKYLSACGKVYVMQLFYLSDTVFRKSGQCKKHVQVLAPRWATLSPYITIIINDFSRFNVLSSCSSWSSVWQQQPLTVVLFPIHCSELWFVLFWRGFLTFTLKVRSVCSMPQLRLKKKSNNLQLDRHANVPTWTLTLSYSQTFLHTRQFRKPDSIRWSSSVLVTTCSLVSFWVGVSNSRSGNILSKHLFLFGLNIKHWCDLPLEWHSQRWASTLLTEDPWFKDWIPVVTLLSW